ncbi:DUF2798 domain-containing protein [Enterococcus sp. BWR-S5]|uniref:DUF2798 domain-containing protein n=1 Tax=Enterococcus sp. BWR-S5 TaxID=2787714 RepID=UPI0019243F91|nr:DUF2798 domain-containing protein [Enterococcus sp. BWR-S5]MBL1225463.1 DUF2798 domain-containing protein [Enterococcus sp. BWR-S5]
MPTNKKEQIVFTLMMCTMMVFGMSVYNTFLHTGLEGVTLNGILPGFLPAFAVALLLDVIIVGPVAKSIAFKLLGKNKGKMPLTALVISGCMVFGMVLCMSLFGLIMQQNFSGNVLMNYFQAMGLNAVCAFPLQLLIVGPVSRVLLKKMQ